MNKKDFPTAIKYLKKAQTPDDTDFNAEIQYDIAGSYELNNDNEQAVIEYLKASYMYPRNIFWSARAELKCAKLLEKMQKWDQAINVYERLAGRELKESEFAKERLEWLKNKN